MDFSGQPHRLNVVMFTRSVELFWWYYYSDPTVEKYIQSRVGYGRVGYIVEYR